MDDSTKHSFKFFYRFALSGLVAMPFYVLFYYSFLSPQDHIDAAQMELRYALFFLILAYSLAILYTYASGQLILIAFVALGPAMYFAFPKIVILTMYPEDILNMSPMSTKATYLFLESWMMVLMTYIAIRALLRLMTSDKKFSLEDRQRFVAPPIPQAAWNCAFASFIVFGIWESSLSQHVRTASAVCILATRPPKQYIHPILTSLVVLGMCLYDFLVSGFISTGFLSSFLILFSGLSGRIKTNVIIGIFAIITFSYVQICKYEYRNLVTINPDLKFEERIKILEFWLAFRLATVTGESEVEDVNQPSMAMRVLSGGLTDRGVLSRIHDDSLERVIEFVPHRIPYWEGRTLKRLPYFFIPRQVWAEKPGRDFLNEFGRLFGYLGDDDFQTSVGCNLLADGYLNFGYNGVYAFSIILALITVFLEVMSKFILKEIHSVALLSFSALYIGPLDADATVSSAIFLSIGLVLMDLLFLRRHRRARLPTQADPYVDAA